MVPAMTKKVVIKCKLLKKKVKTIKSTNVNVETSYSDGPRKQSACDVTWLSAPLEPLKATNQLADVFELNAPSTNQRASRLYSRSGFGCDREGARLRQACFLKYFGCHFKLSSVPG